MDTNTGNILIYQNEKGDTKVDAYFNDDTIWMTQRSMCEPYQVSKSSISEHIKNIYLDHELEEIQLFGNSEQLGITSPK
ncbi:hypothetical protein [Clostridium sp. OF09-36]|uniref:hypothetical protein n=1 Tax=Clostridium sp. OF09-36 TaxID=2292310 RepID=UPI0015F998F6|nr:hypothetical protein [Clostridium sp. OF09-36]